MILEATFFVKFIELNMLKDIFLCENLICLSNYFTWLHSVHCKSCYFGLTKLSLNQLNKCFIYFISVNLMDSFEMLSVIVFLINNCKNRQVIFDLTEGGICSCLMAVTIFDQFKFTFLPVEYRS